MNESILKALMRLFAIIANVDENGVSKSARSIVVSYLSLLLNQETVEQYIKLFEDYVKIHHKFDEIDSLRKRKRTSVNSVKVLMICNEINEELHQEDKIIVLTRLLEFVSEEGFISEEELEFVSTVADVFNISEEEYSLLKNLVTDTLDQIAHQSKILIIDSNEPENNHYRHIKSTHLNGKISIVFIKSTNIFIFRYDGNDSIFLNSHNILPHRVYVLDSGAVIKGSKMSPVYHSDVSGAFIHLFNKNEIFLNARNIRFKYKNSENGIHYFDFCEKSGRLIGIMGGSGVGKSTFLNVINGNFPLHEGEITINGYNIFTEKKMLEGVIGFVPQDDLLIEELTVFQNLYYNTKLCFNNFNEEQIITAVNKVLSDLDLEGVKSLKVGSPLNKFISGGQRKRLNIALELIREPSVLIVDEPTSGLSSMDSEVVMSLLKEQTLKGKLVILNIHQPSSYIYKLFDSLLMLDKGGYPVYYGNPIDAISYFKKAANYVNADENECPECGNVNSELSLQILEAKMVDEYGKFTKERKISPKEWYTAFKSKIQTQEIIDKCPKSKKTTLPENNFKIPGKLKQLIIFTKRNILSKLTNKQYLLVTFLEAPLLAVILGYFTKYISGTDTNPDLYIFAENMNIPAFLFMAVTVALFFGMTLSAEEIIKDRKILKREKFLNLSKSSYLNSKILVLFLISAIQILSFIVVGNFILGIKGMTFTYWIILFSTAAFANILGLNISSAFNSVVTIYIIIPFILVPQLLFSGVIVDFTKLHKKFTSYNYVPVIGDIMTSRWAYEAIAVSQFKDNKYEKYFFKNDLAKSNTIYILSFFIPEIEKRMNSLSEKSELSNIDIKTQKQIIINSLSELNYPDINSLINEKNNEKSFSSENEKAVNNFLAKEKQKYNAIQYKLNVQSDSIFNTLVAKLGSREKVFDLKKDYYNKQLADILKNKSEFSSIKEIDKKLVQITDPIFKIPSSNYGRAHFYSHAKKIGNIYIDTVTFNVIFIWFTTLLLYFALQFDLFKKLLLTFSKEQEQ